MMYLNEPSLWDVVKQSFRFKLKANVGSFSTFILIQLGVMFLAFSSGKHTFFYSSISSITVIDLTNNMNVGLSLVWGFILGIIITTAPRRNEAFSFVTTRFSNQLANLLFMLVAALFAGVISTLAGPVLKLAGILRYSEIVVYSPSIIEAPADFFLRIITAIAYVLLFFLIGYTISSLIQLNKLFIGIFIILWILMSSVSQTWDGTRYLLNIVTFFSDERTLPLFLLKISGTVLALFAISAISTNRLEVRN